MTLKDIDINTAIADAEKLLKDEKYIAPSVRTVISMLLLIVKLLVTKTGTNSQNSSVPPSQDQHRERKKKSAGSRKSGGQPGRKGTTLSPIENPDEVCAIRLDGAHFHAATGVW